MRRNPAANAEVVVTSVKASTANMRTARKRDETLIIARSIRPLNSSFHPDHFVEHCDWHTSHTASTFRFDDLSAVHRLMACPLLALGPRLIGCSFAAAPGRTRRADDGAA